MCQLQLWNQRYDVIESAAMTAQTGLWSHFQTQRAETFNGAANRLSTLLRIAKKYTEVSSLLNIGCGDGSLERMALAHGWRVVSVDPDAKSIERLRSQGIDAKCGVIESIPAGDASFAVVIATEVFEHLTPEVLSSGLSEIVRVLAPRGLLIGTVPYRENLADGEIFCQHCGKISHRWGHQQSFDVAKMSAILSEHFALLHCRPLYFAPWNILNWKGKIDATIRTLLSIAGSHGSQENLLFVARKP